MVSSQKDRVIIIGGKDSDDQDSKVVEEIDFIKRNIVSLSSLNIARSNASAFIVNDAIYVYGGSSSSHHTVGEKYTLNENRWREIKPKNPLDSSEGKSVVSGPSALLYE